MRASVFSIYSLRILITFPYEFPFSLVVSNWNRSKFRRPISRQSDRTNATNDRRCEYYATCGRIRKKLRQLGEHVSDRRKNSRVTDKRQSSRCACDFVRNRGLTEERGSRVGNYARHKPFFVSVPVTLSILRRVIPSGDLQRRLNPLKFNERTSMPRIVDPIFRWNKPLNEEKTGSSVRDHEA